MSLSIQALTGKYNSIAHLRKINAASSVESKLVQTNSTLPKPLPISNEASVINVAQWLSQSDLVTKLTYHIAPDLASKQNKLILKFQLVDGFISNFILLKGLFEFSNASAFSITTQRADQTFALEIKSADAHRAIHELETVFNWLAKEIAFKARLKEVIKFEQRIREEQKLAYNGLRSVLA